MKTTERTNHGYPVIFAIDEQRFPTEWEFIVANRGNDEFQPYVSWSRCKKTGNTYHGNYFESLQDAVVDAMRRSGH